LREGIASVVAGSTLHKDSAARRIEAVRAKPDKVNETAKVLDGRLKPGHDQWREFSGLLPGKMNLAS
jgi:hypothetical protein